MGDVEKDGTVRLGGVGGTYNDPNKADRNGYVGVDPMYANAANETDYPLEADDESDDSEKDEKPAKKPAAKKDETPSTPAPPASPAS